MELDSIKKIIDSSLSTFFKVDKYLIEENANERAITHRLGIYIESGIEDIEGIAEIKYDVDCEYNVNIDAENGRKEILVEQNECLKEYAKRIKNKEEKFYQDEIFYSFSVFPDIIIHERGENSNNLLIIEVKKSTNRDGEKFDFLKLKKYTDQDSEQSLKYKYGVFIYLDVENNKPNLVWFENGDIM
jgi:hypothetical protein